MSGLTKNAYDACAKADRGYGRIIHAASFRCPNGKTKILTLALDRIA